MAHQKRMFNLKWQISKISCIIKEKILRGFVKMNNLTPGDWENKKEFKRFVMVKSEIKKSDFLKYSTYGILIWLTILLFISLNGWGIVLFFVFLLLVAFSDTIIAYSLFNYEICNYENNESLNQMGGLGFNSDVTDTGPYYINNHKD